ncbi:MAG TPA: hypothetical protein VMK42_02385 [Anaeromyxobacteraceae bacterium]|nr:hypothetical protein [Anaeromyxobacteraceae bacterium]
MSVTLGSPTPFATHAQFAASGFQWGPPDGALGAVASGGGNYTFFGSAMGAATASASGPACSGSAGLQGAFAFEGSLEKFSGLTGAGCKALFTKGAAPSGWVFDKDYAGGGSVMPFAAGATGGLLMTYHGEVHWKNPGTANGLCNSVPCFYGGIGLAVSLDGGAVFKSVGQIIQPYQPLSVYQGSSQNVGVGYGSMVLADSSGNWLAAPAANPSSTYLYVFYEDYLPTGAGGTCANAACVTVARARLDQVLAAVVPLASSSPTTVAALFRKYDATASDPWSEPATSGDPTENTASGSFTPLFPDGNSFLPSVIWDSALKAYLLVHQRAVGGAQPTNFIVRSSTDLLHWSSPLATYAPPPGSEPFYPTLVGEGGDPLVGGSAPRLFFDTFPSNFPNWETSELDSLPVQVSAGK